MRDDKSSPEPAPQRRYVASVTPGELRQTDLEAPISGSQSFDTHQLAALYQVAAVAAEKDGRLVDGLVYTLFQNLLEMQFKPADRAEPYGPYLVLKNGRSMVLSDIPFELSTALGASAEAIKHSVLRARVADIAWTANRKLGQCAAIAVDAYCEGVEELRAGTLERRTEDGDVTDFDVMERLHRACQIALATGGKNPLPNRLCSLISTSRQDAFARRYLHGFCQSADIDLDFSISPPADIAKEAEQLADSIPPSGNVHLPLAVLELSSRAFRNAGDTANQNRLAAKTAEWCVACAGSFDNAPMLESHWLTRAIGIYAHVRAEKARRNELRKRLIDVQARTLDDFAPIGHSIDISDIVKGVEQRISGQPLAKAFGALVVVSKSPSPDTLKSDAQAAIKKSPLSSLFSTQVLDQDGKIKFQSPGVGGSNTADLETALRFQILQQESIRRGLLTKSTIDHARAIINAEHGITVEKLMPLVQASPFVPPGYEYVFAQGFARWFGGDLVSATSILVPQLENSLRYILKNAGEDVSTMKNDGTQEDRSIQALFDQMRDRIVRVVDESIAFEIENLFLFRAGPGVRHSIAHGQFSTGHFYSDDASYACWFIFHLCFLPLLTQWDQVEAYLNSL